MRLAKYLVIVKIVPGDPIESSVILADCIVFCRHVFVQGSRLTRYDHLERQLYLYTRRPVISVTIAEHKISQQESSAVRSYC